MKENFIISLADAPYEQGLLEKAGGKFFGLMEAKKIIGAIPTGCDVQVRVPQTWVLSTDVFEAIRPDNINKCDDYFAQLKMPKEVVYACKKLLVKCHGKMALRSSADIEDAHCGGKTYSGAFNSYLNVRIHELEDKLKSVYQSLYNPVVMADCNPEQLKMAVILQEMIEKPKISGVVYSQAFNDTSSEENDAAKVVIHYVENDTADRMIMAQEKGGIIQLPKFIASSARDNGFELCDINSLHHNGEYMSACQRAKKAYGVDAEEYDRSFSAVAFRQLGALVNQMEQTLGHPIDMEFAITTDPKSGKPVINVLQQRPYYSVDDFLIKSYSHTLTGYPSDKGNKVRGDVVVIESHDWISSEMTDDMSLPDMNGKIVLLRRDSYEEFVRKNPQASCEDYDRYNLRTLLMHHQLVGYELYREAAAIVDTTGLLLDALYGHYGNELRRNQVPFVISGSKNFDAIGANHSILLDVDKGQFEFVGVPTRQKMAKTPAAKNGR